MNECIMYNDVNSYYSLLRVGVVYYIKSEAKSMRHLKCVCSSHWTMYECRIIKTSFLKSTDTNLPDHI